MSKIHIPSLCPAFIACGTDLEPSWWGRRERAGKTESPAVRQKKGMRVKSKTKTSVAAFLLLLPRPTARQVPIPAVFPCLWQHLPSCRRRWGRDRAQQLGQQGGAARPLHQRGGSAAGRGIQLHPPAPDSWQGGRAPGRHRGQPAGSSDEQEQFAVAESRRAGRWQLAALRVPPQRHALALP